MSLGPAALVVFGGIYWGMSTGDVVAVAAIYFEAGIFDDQLYKKDIDPTYKYWSRSTEAGVGIGQESGVSEADFTHPGLELEFVGQIGPLVGVKSRTMWAAFYSTHIAFGGGTLVPLPMLAWSKRIADAR